MVVEVKMCDVIDIDLKESSSSQSRARSEQGLQYTGLPVCLQLH
jgi:hypothetical protein